MRICPKVRCPKTKCLVLHEPLAKVEELHRFAFLGERTSQQDIRQATHPSHDSCVFSEEMWQVVLRTRENSMALQCCFDPKLAPKIAAAGLVGKRSWAWPEPAGRAWCDNRAVPPTEPLMTHPRATYRGSSTPTPCLRSPGFT